MVSHVKYELLVADPVGSIQRLYAEGGWEFTPEYETALVEYVAKNKAERHEKKKKASAGGLAGGGHEYSLERFGLEAAELSKELKWYVDKYL